MHRSHVAWLNNKHSLQFLDEELDDSRMKPSQVLAETLYSCISPGTEIAAFLGLPPLRPMRVYPRLVGYCNVARVLASGNEAGTVKPGDIIYTHQSHRSHFICTETQISGILNPAARRDDLIALAPMYLYHLSYNALLKAKFFPGMRVAVVGLGCLGLTTLQLLSALSAPTVGFTRRDVGPFAPYRDALSDIRRLDAGGDDGTFDVVIVTSNSWRDWERALQLARKGGTVASLSFPGRGEQAPDLNPLDSRYTYDKQLELVFCGYSPDLDVEPWDIRFTLKRNSAYLLKLITAGRLPSSRLVSFVAPWQDLKKTYEAIADRNNNIVTAVLDWTSND
jgi:NADPH:quinone reductase-like Zn-dependent oxidoreductase